jgi:hypothetical protein
MLRAIEVDPRQWFERKLTLLIAGIRQLRQSKFGELAG